MGFVAREDSGKPAGIKPVVKSIGRTVQPKIKKELLPEEKFAKKVAGDK